jgi:uncharacterized protein (DUF362 family)
MEKQASKICVERVDNIYSYVEIKRSLFSILDQLKGGINLAPTSTVLVKLNLCLLKGPETGATVDPRVAGALAEWILECYPPQKIYLAESDATHLSADMAFKALGWREYFKDHPKVQFLNLSNDERVSVKGRYLKNLEMSKTMIKVDFLISLAKLKTHTQQKITCVMKNQFGAIPYKYKIIYHPVLANAIYDATLARIPDLSIIDGLIAMEGNGPTNGIPKRTKLLIASNDPFSLDHFCARLMGFKPMSVPHLKLAYQRGLGKTQYEVVGNGPNPLNLRFKFLPKWKRIAKRGIGLMQRGTINEEA